MTKLPLLSSRAMSLRVACRAPGPVNSSLSTISKDCWYFDCRVDRLPIAPMGSAERSDAPFLPVSVCCASPRWKLLLLNPSSKPSSSSGMGGNLPTATVWLDWLSAPRLVLAAEGGEGSAA